MIQKRKVVQKMECKNWLHVCVIALLALFVLTFSIAAASAEGGYTFITKWGCKGTGDGEFGIGPAAIAVDSSGYVYVTDYYNNRIQKFDSVGNFITKWGSYGTGDGEFHWAEGIAVDSSGYVYVTDRYNHRIQKFDSVGNFITKWGCGGTGDGEFSAPFGIVVDSSGYVYVADTENYRIQKFDSIGNFITKWGSRGSGVGEFDWPGGIAVDSSGYVYVADTHNHRIQKFDSVGNFITKWGCEGTGDGEFYYPGGIAVDSSGYVYVADYYNNRIQKFDSGGTFITKWGSYGSGDGEFYYPLDIAVESSGNVYVDDTGNYRIQKFAPYGGTSVSFTQHAPPSSNVGTGTPNVLVNTLNFTATENILVDNINITLYGSGSSADIGDIKIYKETGGSGFDPFADLDISDSATADAWVGSVCTVTLGTGGSNVPQTVEVGDATWYLVFDIAPDATVGDTVGGKIAFGADISAKVAGETVVAQKVGDDPTEVRTIIKAVGLFIETEHFNITFCIPGDGCIWNVDPTDNNGNDIPDYLDLVSVSLENAYDFYRNRDFYEGRGCHYPDKYTVSVSNLITNVIGNPESFGCEITLDPRSQISLLNNDRNGRVPVRETCFHEYFHAVQQTHRAFMGGVGGRNYFGSQWVFEGTATLMETIAPSYPDTTFAATEFIPNYLSHTYKDFRSLNYEAVLYWLFIAENSRINFDGDDVTFEDLTFPQKVIYDNIEAIRRIWVELGRHDDPINPYWHDNNEVLPSIDAAYEEAKPSDFTLNSYPLSYFDRSFMAFCKANYFTRDVDIDPNGDGNYADGVNFYPTFTSRFINHRRSSFVKTANLGHGKQIKYYTRGDWWTHNIECIENYGAHYFEIDASQTSEVKVTFDGYGHNFFVMEYLKGEESRENILTSCLDFDKILHNGNADGTVYIIGRLGDSGSGDFEIIFEDVTPSTPTTTDSTILPTQRIPITTSIDPTTEATFKLLWQGSTLNLTLLTPEDVLIDPTTTDPNITHVKNATYEYYTIQNPAPGDWTMNILAVDVPQEGENFTAVVYVATNLTLSLDTDKYRYDPGESISIQANLTNNSTPVTGASVQAEVQRPDGSENITLFDDGTHSDAQTSDGVYSNTYTATRAGGTYIIKATARGTIDGYPFVRERQRSVLVQLAPDLIVADIIFSDNAPSSGDVITINASIQNIGGVNASHFSVEFYDGDPYVDGTYIGSEPITTNLTLGEAVNATTSWTAKSGSHNLFVRVPPLALEINESNNIANKTVHVTPIYNLSIIAAGTDKSIYAPNENVTIYCIVENADHELFSPDIVYAEIKNHTFNLSEYSTGCYMGIFNQTSQAGTYNITVYANKTGYENDTFGLCFEVVSENQAPFANFTYSPRYPVVNQSITFNASNSTDHDGYITNYKWEFGNGNITDTTAPIINHKYALAGDYTVNLTVTDNNESTDSTSQLIKVTRKVPPEITFYAPESSVNDTVCTWRTFNITVNQKVNVSWYLNNTLKHTNESTKEASSTFHADDMGEHNVTAIARNANGTAIQMWIWNVTEESSYTFVLSTGWNMISFPVEPLDNDADTIFGPEYYYLCTWDSVAGGYVSINEVETEIGYWLLVLEDRNVTVLGTPLPEYNTNLTQGWNMIGSMWTATNVPGGTETVPADQVYPHFYTWCGDHYELTQDIDPGLGYWALAYVDCELHVFPAPQAAPPLSMHIPRGESDWGVKLDVTCGAGTDIAEFGLNVDATDGFDAEFDVPEAPPPPPPYQQACFYYPENPLVKKLSTSYIPHHFVDSKELNTWPFQLDYNGDASEVTITWNATDIAAVPTNYSLLFGVDGEKIDMRSTPSYTFSATTGTYEFEIRATTGGEKPDLVITELYETFVDDRNFNITYMVNNTGCADAGPSNTTIYIDDDPLEVPTPAIPKYERYENIVDDDPLEVPTPAIPKYECYENTVGPFECPCGEILNVTVCADNGNVINESNETNNCEVNIIECPPPRPGIEVNKTVWDKESQSWVDETTAEISEIVRFRCEMHNNGTCCPLTNLVVTDTLSDGLEYADNVTIYLSDDIIDLIEPFRVGGTYIWKFPNMVLVPCDTITIEFDAHVIKSGRNWNKQNATAGGCGKIVSDEDYAYVMVPVTKKPDLTVTEITVNYDAPGLGGRAIGLEPGVGMHTECNNISARIEEVKGVNVVSPFDVSFEIDEVQICSVRVPGLTAGSNKRVYCNGSWYPMAGDDFAIIVTADSKHVIPETNETDNTKWNNGTVVSNGYKGNGWQGPDMNLENVQCLDQDTINLIYSVGDSYYLSGAKQWTKYTANWAANDLPVPEFTNVEAAAYIETAILYVYYTWDKDKVMPDNVDLKFNDNDIQYSRHYSDRKGFGGYDYPAGMLVYKVTDEFNAAGNNKAELTKSVATDEVSMTGMLLMVVYKHPDEPERIICIDDGFDMLYANENYAVSSEEATTYAPFTCCEPIQIEEIVNAILIAVAPNAADGDYKNRLSFNDGLWNGVWDHYEGATELGIAETNVLAHLQVRDNVANFQSHIPAGGTKGDFMEASNAFLILEKSGEPGVPGVPNADTNIEPTQ
jgi:uncharacterized repeat protein (TIGR01451 family)